MSIPSDFGRNMLPPVQPQSFLIPTTKQGSLSQLHKKNKMVHQTISGIKVNAKEVVQIIDQSEQPSSRPSPQATQAVNLSDLPKVHVVTLSDNLDLQQVQSGQESSK